MSNINVKIVTCEIESETLWKEVMERNFRDKFEERTYKNKARTEHVSVKSSSQIISRLLIDKLGTEGMKMKHANWVEIECWGYRKKPKFLQYMSNTITRSKQVSHAMINEVRSKAISRKKRVHMGIYLRYSNDQVETCHHRLKIL